MAGMGALSSLKQCQKQGHRESGLVAQGGLGIHYWALAGVFGLRLRHHKLLLLDMRKASYKHCKPNQTTAFLSLAPPLSQSALIFLISPSPQCCAGRSGVTQSKP